MLRSGYSNVAVRNITRTATRCIHGSIPRRAITNLEMPAMSPTMTEGGISSWKKKEGEPFTAGDVLLEIETDKATIDVEAQEDGVMGKILLQDGSKNVPVGKVIALLAEEGDDISNLEAPKEESKPPKQEEKSAASSSTPPPPEPSSGSKETPAPQAVPSHSHEPPSHSRPLFPSVLRILTENGISDASKIKGTGVRGMLTKGDVLAFLGKASSPLGTFKETDTGAPPKAAAKPTAEEVKPLDGPSLRRLIVSNMLRNSVKARNAVPATSASFDSLVEDYLGPTPASAFQSQAPKKPAKAVPLSKKSTEEYFQGLL